MHRALSWFIDCPRDSSVDWNVDNVWAADNALCIIYYYLYFIEENKTFSHVGLHWQLLDLRCVLKKGRNSKTSSGH
jgi:hypothetical protein